jgi:hypothetical protein
MADISAIAAALSSFNTLKNIAQAMITLRDAQALQTKIIEFNGALIEAQTKIFEVHQERTALVEEIGALKAEITALKNWEAEKQRYQLEELPPGVFVYRLKLGMADGEPPHCICERCCQEGKKALLHRDEEVNGIYRLKCNRCGTILDAGRWIQPRSTQIRYDPFEGM